MTPPNAPRPPDGQAAPDDDAIPLLTEVIALPEPADDTADSLPQHELAAAPDTRLPAASQSSFQVAAVDTAPPSAPLAVPSAAPPATPTTVPDRASIAHTVEQRLLERLAADPQALFGPELDAVLDAVTTRAAARLQADLRQELQSALLQLAREAVARAVAEAFHHGTVGLPEHVASTAHSDTAPITPPPSQPPI